MVLRIKSKLLRMFLIKVFGHRYRQKIHSTKFILLVLCYLMLILYVNFTSKVPNCYVDKSWNDGKALEEVSQNMFLRTQTSTKNVFFLETSLIDDGIIKLNATQACAIESAALMNPDHNIYVFFTSYVGFRNKTNLPIIDAVLSYPNVHFNYLNIFKYAENTPLEDWVKTKNLFQSKFLEVHTNDVLKYLTLWKFGGTYLDLDVVMLKSLNIHQHYNYAGAESDYEIAVGILHLEGATGHEIADLCVNDLMKNFKGSSKVHNGPWVLMRVLSRMCKPLNIEEIIMDGVCENFRVLPSQMCYNINTYDWMKFFMDEFVDEALVSIKDSLMIHVWNYQSAKFSLKKNANAAYIHIAKKFCPKTFQACEEF